MLRPAPLARRGVSLGTRDAHGLVILLAGVDLLSVLGAFVAAGRLADLAAYSVAAPVWLLLAYGHGLYRADRLLCHGTSDEVPALLYWAALGTGATALIDRHIGSLSGLVLGATALTLAVALRGVVRILWRMSRAPERALVIGGDEVTAELVHRLELEPGQKVVVAGTLHGAIRDREHPRFRDPEVGEIEQIVTTQVIDRLIIAQSDLDERWLRKVVSLCRQADIRLTVVPAAAGAIGTGTSLGHMAELPLLEFGRWHPSGAVFGAKRMMDIFGAGIGLVALGPLMAAIAVAIRLDSRGPALYRQARGGLEGRPFTILKFRTMVEDADARLAELVDIDGLAQPVYKLTSDPRVTRLGRVLRRASLDELPQLINVMRGQMSLVGPRPEDIVLVKQYDEPARQKLALRPGITGPMQVYGRADLTFDDRLAVERDYVENLSLTRDLKILVRTLAVVAGGRGAY